MVFLWFSYEITMKSPRFFLARISVLLPFQAMVTCEKSNGKIVGSFKNGPPTLENHGLTWGIHQKVGYVCIYYIYYLYIIYIYLLYNIEWYDVNEPFLFGKKSYWLGSPWCLLQVDWTNFRPGKASTDTRHFCRLFVSGNCRPNKILQVY